jgi:hypothetical protein
VTREVKVLAASGAATDGRTSSAITANPLALDIMANSAWRNLRWTQEGQWDGIRKGITEEKVVELLGKAPRSVKSLKPRVDKGALLRDQYRRPLKRDARQNQPERGPRGRRIQADLLKTFRDLVSEKQNKQIKLQ